MGTTTLLDIIGSISTFGLLLLAVLRLNASASEYNYSYNENYLLQRNMVLLTVMLEDDLKRVGAEVNDAYGGIQFADSSDLRFRTFLPTNLTNNPNVVEWRLEATGPPNIPNPNIRYISRIVDGVTTRMNLGVRRFKFNYWNVYTPSVEILPPISWTPVASPTGNIGPVSVLITLESSYRMKQQYMADTSQYDMVWRQLRSLARNNSIQFPTGR